MSVFNFTVHGMFSSGSSLFANSTGFLYSLVEQATINSSNKESTQPIMM